MLKYLLMLCFLIPIGLLENCWWLVHSLMFLLSFIFMFSVYSYSDLNMIGYFFGIDYFSFMLILLSFWIVSLMITASSSVYLFSYHSNFFIFLVLLLLVTLYCSFSSLSLLSFYIFFESSLIPTMLLILGWGYQPERLQAGIYLIFYTLVASLPLLLVLFKINNIFNTLYFPLLFDCGSFYFMFYVFILFAFLVSMPMFLFHLWLPSAHVEAPISGSMILAGVLLKLGGYGIFRVMKIISFLGLSFNYFWLSLSLFGGVIVSFICIRQVDLKSLIAYSSVAHMSMVIGGLMTMNWWGFMGSLSLMVGHGLCSSGLFCLSNIIYERLGSRSLLINKGMINLMPTMSFWWFLLSSSNMAAPPSLNLFGEFSLLNSIISWSPYMFLLLIFLSFFSAVYTLYMYSYSQHGFYYSGIYTCSLGYFREYHLLFLHWFPLNILCLKSEYFYF
uniref:NADH-ubiquinone oxidoreductase chain 4 n=4 Tax=Oedipodinae TaxID=27549 RepID=A0A0U1XRK1_9ORTH|nr:NADH dehydrogenase subunit 4 [Angaracris barabensis]YP_009112338.1 NADH dehydrogenase subunit 4 [Angaracris rhodopa]YP_009740636.1 NADH dehydrogenase subunit 4 [Bryodemella holdereri holdereri]YP_009740727.1 NADH dehydrogenase subunit 4 [Bryodema dolichoptera]AIT96938.1 NADH dehydrogenase subunit 4 [Angaracris barabensis]AIY61460.1 NADH dehydrogenase subunit 4 [Angaracris rhodopa]QID03598.1 NADH dehydrogenase subunit 4 [Bryodemella holdereri holdereri]QID03702.1 NADH dehydrogenase subunit